jgi:hypothetical protein
MRPVLSPCVQAGLILAWTCTAARGGPLPPPTAAAYAGEAATAAAAPSAASPAVGALPALNIDTDAITISGISSGADFVVNMQVAHSELIAGVGVFAGQAYHCAVTRFPPDPLRPASSDVPVCDGCPDGMTLGYDHCKQHPEYVDVDLLVEYARNQSALGTIDNVSNLANRQLYFYRGTHDTCYKTGAEEVRSLAGQQQYLCRPGFHSQCDMRPKTCSTCCVGNAVLLCTIDWRSRQQQTSCLYAMCCLFTFFHRYCVVAVHVLLLVCAVAAIMRTPCRNATDEGSVGSNHAQPTFSWGAPCGGKGNKTFSYIESCGYDGAGAVLQHMYPNLTRPAVSSSEVSYDSANLVQFDQSAYWVRQLA